MKRSGGQRYWRTRTGRERRIKQCIRKLATFIADTPEFRAEMELRYTNQLIYGTTHPEAWHYEHAMTTPPDTGERG